MIINHLIFALRLLRRDKFHSSLNIIGLSTGIACGIIILLYLQNELTYDSYHKNADRIFRVAAKGIPKCKCVRGITVTAFKTAADVSKGPSISW